MKKKKKKANQHPETELFLSGGGVEGRGQEPEGRTQEAPVDLESWLRTRAELEEQTRESPADLESWLRVRVEQKETDQVGSGGSGVLAVVPEGQTREAPAWPG